MRAVMSLGSTAEEVVKVIGSLLPKLPPHVAGSLLWMGPRLLMDEGIPANEKTLDVFVSGMVGLGLDINYRDPLYGQTPLAQVIHNADGASFAALIRAHADVACRANEGTTPLMAAANRVDGVKVRRLLDLGADATARDNLGQSALHHMSGDAWERTSEVSLKEDVPGIIDNLLAAGCDREVEDNSGRTAFDLIVNAVERDGNWIDLAKFPAINRLRPHLGIHGSVI